MKKIVKIDVTNFETTDLGSFKFVPLLKEKGKDL